MIEASYICERYDEYNDINLNTNKGYCKQYEFTISKESKTIILGKNLKIVILRNVSISEKINSNVFIKDVK